MRLFHYTCDDHGLPGIQATGRLQPMPYKNSAARAMKLPEPPVKLQVLWLTDVVDPGDGQPIGLRGLYTDCNRLAARFIVRTDDAVRWTDWAEARDITTDNYWRWALELGHKPERWWVLERVVLPPDFERDWLWRGPRGR